MPLSIKALVAVTLLAALPVAAQEENPFEATGELRFHGYGAVGSSAAFDATRVVGPSVNLTRREDGTWGGDLAGHNLDLRITGNRITGSNVNLVLTQKGDRTEVEGLFFGARVRVEMDRKRLHGRFGTCSVDLARSRNPGALRGNLGCFTNTSSGVPRSGSASMQLIGEAAAEAPPMPQFALALLAVMPG